MPPLHLRFQRSFYIRHGLIGGMFLFFCLVMVLMLKQAGLLRFLAPVVFLGPWFFLVRREWRLAARRMDDTGVVRHDGRQFLWADLTEVREVHMVLNHGRRGPLNHVDLHFRGGKVRILFMVLENGWEGIEFAKRKEAVRLGELRKRICQLLARNATMTGKLSELRRAICRLIAQETQRRTAAGPERQWREPEKEEHRAAPAWPERREW